MRAKSLNFINPQPRRREHLFNLRESKPLGRGSCPVSPQEIDKLLPMLEIRDTSQDLTIRFQPDRRVSQELWGDNAIECQTVHRIGGNVWAIVFINRDNLALGVNALIFSTDSIAVVTNSDDDFGVRGEELDYLMGHGLWVMGQLSIVPCPLSLVTCHLSLV